MVSKKRLSSEELEKVLALPKCQIDGSVSSMAHIDICSASKKLGGIYVTIYPIINDKIKGPREIRQKIVMDSVIQKDIVSSAKSKKKQKKAKKKPLSTEKHLPGHTFIRA